MNGMPLLEVSSLEGTSRMCFGKQLRSIFRKPDPIDRTGRQPGQSQIERRSSNVPPIRSGALRTQTERAGQNSECYRQRAD